MRIAYSQVHENFTTARFRCLKLHNLGADLSRLIVYGRSVSSWDLLHTPHFGLRGGGGDDGGDEDDTKPPIRSAVTAFVLLMAVSRDTERGCHSI